MHHGLSSCLILVRARQVPEHVLKGVAAALADSQLLTVSEDGTRIKRTQVGWGVLIAFMSLTKSALVLQQPVARTTVVWAETCSMT